MAGSLFAPTPFDLILKGTRDIIAKQEADAGMTMQEQRDQVLGQFLGSQGEEEYVESSAIESFAYTEDIAALSVKWLDSRGNPSHEYLYYNVSPVIAQGLEDAPSKGTYMNEVIKAGFFPFTRLS